MIQIQNYFASSADKIIVCVCGTLLSALRTLCKCLAVDSKFL